MSEIDRELVQQLYNVAVTRNPIIYLYIIKNLSRNKPFLSELQGEGHFSINEDKKESVPIILKYFDEEDLETKYELAKVLIKKLKLLECIYETDNDIQSFESKSNINFEIAGTSLKQIHKTVGKGYTKSYMQKIVVGKLKQIRSPNDGKYYSIIISNSIESQKTKIYSLTSEVYEFLEKEDSILGEKITKLFYYELELKYYLDDIQKKRKRLSQLQMEFANFNKELKELEKEQI